MARDLSFVQDCVIFCGQFFFLISFRPLQGLGPPVACCCKGGGRGHSVCPSFLTPSVLIHPVFLKPLEMIDFIIKNFPHRPQPRIFWSSPQWINRMVFHSICPSFPSSVPSTECAFLQLFYNQYSFIRLIFSFHPSLIFHPVLLHQIYFPAFQGMFLLHMDAYQTPSQSMERHQPSSHSHNRRL